MEELQENLRKSIPEALGSLICVIVITIVTYIIKNWLRRKKSMLRWPWHKKTVSIPPGPDDTMERLRTKLDRLHDLLDCPFCLVGGVYLDISVGPIRTTELEEQEWTDVDPMKYDIGGSTLWVGRFLWEKGQKSYLFSAIGGSDDPHTVKFVDFFEDEEWPLNRLAPGDQGSKTAVTVHLIQSHNRFSSMFTHRGALATFGWDSTAQQLSERLADGGVLYISGYLKTNLCTGLVENLANLPQNTLVCIDHGRLTLSQADSPAATALRDAFEARLVDLYFCTYKEIFNILKLNIHRDFPSNWKQVQQMLQDIANEWHLPLITMVRGGNIKEKTKAFVIIGKSVYLLEGSIGPTFIRGAVGPTNAFNANMMYHLVHGPRFHKLEEQVIHAGNRAFEEWRQWTRGF